MKFLAIAPLLLSMSISFSQIPDAPNAVQPIAHKPVESFLANPLNRMLSGAEFSVRMADAITTYRDDGSGTCQGCYEKELPAGLAKSRAGMLAYSAGIAIGVNLGARMLWNHGHKRLARAALLADIAGDGSAVIGNVKAYKAK